MMELFKWLTIIVLGISIGMFFAFAITYRSYPEQKNTFFSSIFNFSLFGRQKEIRHLADRIRTGQSSAIIGFFSEERTSILGYLRNEDSKQREELYGDKADKLIFSYIDIAFLDKEFSPLQFWEMALESLRRKMVSDLELDKAYQECKNNQFKKLNLEILFGLINEKGWRLVLILDRFEELLQHPLGKDWEFITNFRLATSRTPSPLVLITATHLSLKQFHQKVQQISPSTSPVLNFIEGGVIYLLGNLSDAEIHQLLEQNDLSFSSEFRQSIKKMVGGHPYLLKLAIDELKKISLDEESKFFETVEKVFYERVKHLIENTVKKSWSPRMCQAFIAVIQQQEVSDFEKELQKLEVLGIVAKDYETWHNRIGIFAKFMADKDNQLLCQNQTVEN